MITFILCYRFRMVKSDINNNKFIIELENVMFAFEIYVYGTTFCPLSNYTLARQLATG